MNYPKELIKEWQNDGTRCCPNCRSITTKEDMQSRVTFAGGWDSPTETAGECPTCFSDIDELDDLTVDEYAQMMVEQGVKLEDYE